MAKKYKSGTTTKKPMQAYKRKPKEATPANPLRGDVPASKMVKK